MCARINAPGKKSSRFCDADEIIMHTHARFSVLPDRRNAGWGAVPHALARPHLLQGIELLPPKGSVRILSCVGIMFD